MYFFNLNNQQQKHERHLVETVPAQLLVLHHPAFARHDSVRHRPQAHLFLQQQQRWTQMIRRPILKLSKVYLVLLSCNFSFILFVLNNVYE